MTTFTPQTASITRRVAVGLSAGAAGADGVPELAQSAHEALMRAPWVESPDAPSMPVHDNGQTSNRSAPSGDAWKCGYGYDATNRTERAAAGAVCYSFALPRAMVAETDAAAVSGLTVRVIGDRYLDAGARVFATLTGSAQPPTLAEMMGAEAASGVLCATSGQTKPDGVTPLAPNNRTGVRADAQISPATPLAAPEGATAAYLHVCLALVDYTTTRGAWIEGGAMLAPDTLRVTFDREVEADEPDHHEPVDYWTQPLDLETKPVRRMCDRCRISVGPYDSGLAEDVVGRHALASFLEGASSFTETNVTSWPGISRTNYDAHIVSWHGILPGGKVGGLRFEQPLALPCDAHIAIGVHVGGSGAYDNDVHAAGYYFLAESVMSPSFAMSHGPFPQDVSLAGVVQNTLDDIQIPTTVLTAFDVKAGQDIGDVLFDSPLAIDLPHALVTFYIFIYPLSFGGSGQTIVTPSRRKTLTKTQSYSFACPNAQGNPTLVVKESYSQASVVTTSNKPVFRSGLYVGDTRQWVMVSPSVDFTNQSASDSDGTYAFYLGKNWTNYSIPLAFESINSDNDRAWFTARVNDALSEDGSLQVTYTPAGGGESQFIDASYSLRFTNHGGIRFAAVIDGSSYVAQPLPGQQISGTATLQVSFTIPESSNEQSAVAVDFVPPAASAIMV